MTLFLTVIHFSVGQFIVTEAQKTSHNNSLFVWIDQKYVDSFSIPYTFKMPLSVPKIA